MLQYRRSFGGLGNLFARQRGARYYMYGYLHGWYEYAKTDMYRISGECCVPEPSGEGICVARAVPSFFPSWHSSLTLYPPYQSVPSHSTIVGCCAPPAIAPKGPGYQS